MSDGYSSRTWACPFYRKDKKGLYIVCEGGSMALPRRRDREEYVRDYCCSVSGWRRCSIARAVERMYEREEGAP